MPGCVKRVTDLPHLHLCRAHLTIIAQQAGRRPSVQATMQESVDHPFTQPPTPRPTVVDPDRNPVVYYVQVGAHIKIGWTTNLQSRMRSYPPNSILLAVHPGSRADETKLHKRFAHHRTHGREWYAPVPSLLHHIEQMKRQHGEPETVTFGAQPVTIPEPRPTEYVAMRSRSGAHFKRSSA